MTLFIKITYTNEDFYHFYFTKLYLDIFIISCWNRSILKNGSFSFWQKAVENSSCSGIIHTENVHQLLNEAENRILTKIWLNFNNGFSCQTKGVKGLLNETRQI